ncbi:2727_t:CDS:2, partial [Racocetra persica]
MAVPFRRKSRRRVRLGRSGTGNQPRKIAKGTDRFFGWKAPDLDKQMEFLETLKFFSSTTTVKKLKSAAEDQKDKNLLKNTWRRPVEQRTKEPKEKEPTYISPADFATDCAK